MNTRTITVIVLALVAGLAAAFGVRQYLQMTVAQVPKTVVEKVETVKVVVVTEDIPLITTLLEERHLKETDWPKSHVPPGAITDKAEAVGKPVRFPLMRGEPLMDSKIGEGSGLSVLIQEGQRGYTIMTPSDSSGVAGFVMPNDKVDIFLTSDFSDGDGNDDNAENPFGGKLTTLLLGNVNVLAVGQLINVPADGKGQAKKFNSATLEVTPRMAQKLVHAQSEGSLSLALRHVKDDDQVSLAHFTTAELLIDEAKGKEPKKQPSVISTFSFKDAATAFAGFFNSLPAPSEYTTPEQPRSRQGSVLLLRGGSKSVITIQ